MGKHLLFDPITNESQIIEIPDEIINQPIPAPTSEDRLSALEAAMLDLLMGG